MNIKYWFLIFLLTACNAKQEKGNDIRSSGEPSLQNKLNTSDSPNIQLVIIYDVKTGYGYNIFIDGTMTIHQPSIPGLVGNQGFRTQQQALKTGEFVVDKIRHQAMPPSISRSELDSLHVLD
jgi:hypothetical protein